MPAAPSVAVQTSWLRVKGPKDAQSCAWCRTWVERIVPVELGQSYAHYHHQAAGKERLCRCTLEPAELKVSAEDPGCQWA